MSQSLQKATFAMLSTCDKLLAVKSRVETKEMLTASVDAIALVGNVTLKLSALRRKQLKLSLRQEFHMICSNNVSNFYLAMTCLNKFVTPKRIAPAKRSAALYDHNRDFGRNSSWSNRPSDQRNTTRVDKSSLFWGKATARPGKRNRITRGTTQTRNNCLTRENQVSGK